MWIILAVLALPLIEIGLFVTLGAKLGLWLTLAWVVLTAVFGVILLKGVAMLGLDQMAGGMREELRDPLSPLAHRFLVGMAGILLILPGFFTDALGLLLVLPPVRRLLIRFLKHRVKATVVMPTSSSNVVEGDWQDVSPSAPPSADNPPSKWTRH